ncbi:hypothetical protein [Mycoplana ramosa]|uniref:Uncharacterized protein n=1 Tax=Mycoplana ramosa TaxID=40837 RepID=A0ABW3Z252_MYCRA
MFKLSSELTFPWPVKVIEPDPVKAGTFAEYEFQVTFAIIAPDKAKASAEARNAIIARSTPESTLDELKAIQAELELHDSKALEDVVRGWKDIVGEDDKPLPFTPENLATVSQHARVRAALIRAYQEAISEDKARLGN